MIIRINVITNDKSVSNSCTGVVNLVEGYSWQLAILENHLCGSLPLNRQALIVSGWPAEKMYCARVAQKFDGEVGGPPLLARRPHLLSLWSPLFRSPLGLCG